MVDARMCEGELSESESTDTAESFKSDMGKHFCFPLSRKRTKDGGQTKNNIDIASVVPHHENHSCCRNSRLKRQQPNKQIIYARPFNH